MSAEELGKRLVAEVEEEGLDELLYSLRSLQHPYSSPRFGLAPLDSLLQTSTAPITQPAQTYRSSSPVGPRQTEPKHGAVKIGHSPPPIIELTSPGPNDGKTQLLYLLTATLTLPPFLGSTHLGGQNAAVVILDTDTRFSVFRVAQVMRGYISHCLQRQQQQQSSTTPSHHTAAGNGHSGPEPRVSDTDTARATETAIREALKHIHIYRPQSLRSLIATVTALPIYLFDASAHHSCTRRVGAIMLDSASAFVWTERAEAEVARVPGSTSTFAGGEPGPDATGIGIGISGAKVATSSRWAELAARLRIASQTLHCPVVFTAWNLSSPHPTGAGAGGGAGHSFAAIRPQLPPPFGTLPTLRLVISRRHVRKFAPGMSGEEATREAGDRQTVVERGLFDVEVNRWSGVGDGGGGGRRVGAGFVVKITEDGIVLDE